MWHTSSCVMFLLVVYDLERNLLRLWIKCLRKENLESKSSRLGLKHPEGKMSGGKLVIPGRDVIARPSNRRLAGGFQLSD